MADFVPREVSAVKVCFVPRFDSKRKPGSSSLSVVVCWPSVFTTSKCPSCTHFNDQFPTVKLGPPGVERIDWLIALLGTCPLARCNLSRNSLLLSDELEPPSGLPLEYMVASLPSRTKRNHPLLPLESSMAQKSFQRYKQSLPRTRHQSCQWYGLFRWSLVASSE